MALRINPEKLAFYICNVFENFEQVNFESIGNDSAANKVNNAQIVSWSLCAWNGVFMFFTDLQIVTCDFESYQSQTRATILDGKPKKHQGYCKTIVWC